MAEHATNSAADLTKDRGVLLLVVRADQLKDTNVAGTELAGADGRFQPLSVDEDGFLRVNLPDNAVEIAKAERLENKLDDMLSLLRRTVRGLEMMVDNEIQDPAN